MRVAVILPAAGLGTRMGRSTATSGSSQGGTSRKQFLLLDGLPILLHTIRKFASIAAVSEIVVALRQEDLPWFRDLVAQQQLAKPIRLIEGGESRHQSVENALAALDEAVDLVAVHDAVRPFIEPALIDKVIETAAEYDAAIVGIVPVDTVKQVHLNRIRTTIPRDRLVLAQTPQVFRHELLRRAFARARADQFQGTDESSLVERLEEVEVHVVPGSERNIKITRPTDMSLARLFYEQEQTVAPAADPA